MPFCHRGPSRSSGPCSPPVSFFPDICFFASTLISKRFLETVTIRTSGDTTFTPSVIAAQDLLIYLFKLSLPRTHFRKMCLFSDSHFEHKCFSFPCCKIPLSCFFTFWGHFLQLNFTTSLFTSVLSL